MAISSNSILSMGGYHHPSPADVQSVQDTLINYLPVELTDSIADMAEYWPRIVSSVGFKPLEDEDGEGKIEGEECFRVSSRDGRVARWCAVVTEPLMLERGGEGRRGKVRKVRFEIVSHDQGWSGEPEHWKGTYAASYTWFRTSIIRARPNPNRSSSMFGPQSQQTLRDAVLATVPPFDMVPYLDKYGGDDDLGADGKTWTVQTNVHARSIWKRHVVEWGLGDADNVVGPGAGGGEGFVEELKDGDRVVLWACAQFPAWKNHVRFAKVEVFYSV